MSCSCASGFFYSCSPQQTLSLVWAILSEQMTYRVKVTKACETSREVEQIPTHPSKSCRKSAESERKCCRVARFAERSPRVMRGDRQSQGHKASRKSSREQKKLRRRLSHTRREETICTMSKHGRALALRRPRLLRLTAKTP